MLDISDVVARSGVKASALRYYESVGLIQSDHRKGLRRQYEPTVLQRLSLISLGKAAGFSLADIASVFRLGEPVNLPRDQIRKRADALEQEIARLETLVRLLRHVANCPEEHHLACPRFQKLMRVAGR
ncbi:MAG: helix-turn-helix domain-containing protein [Pseudomonadota bacterium]